MRRWKDIPVQEHCEIKYTRAKEVRNEIKNLNKKKSPGFDLINSVVLHNLPRKALAKLTNIINAAFRLKYVPM